MRTLSLLLVTCLTVVAAQSSAQEVHYIKTYHLTVGADLGVYPFGGGFGLGEQELDFQGMHADVIRLGMTQKVAPSFRMGLSVMLGLALLGDPGFTGRDEQGVTGESAFGWHWGVELSGYYRFPCGLTLGAGADISIASGEYLNTSFFRVLPAIGYELAHPLDEWFLHGRWVTGVTVLHGLEELNTDPRSNLTWSGLQVIYGF